MNYIRNGNPMHDVRVWHRIRHAWKQQEWNKRIRHENNWRMKVLNLEWMRMRRGKGTKRKVDLNKYFFITAIILIYCNCSVLTLYLSILKINYIFGHLICVLYFTVYYHKIHSTSFCSFFVSLRTRYKDFGTHFYIS